MTLSTLPRIARGLLLLCLAASLVACGSRPTPTPTPDPTPSATAEAAATAGPTPTETVLPPIEPELLTLPAAFRYEMTLRPAGAATEPYTVVMGQYSDGRWSQSTRQGEDTPEELIVAASAAAGGALHSYTRAATDVVWTRWPGVGFDAAYGLTSPFAVLRLYPLADAQARSEPDPSDPAQAAQVQAVFAPATLARLMKAGASVVAPNVESRAALEAQLAPLMVAQTVNYWVAENGQIERAAATLLTAGEGGEPTPWVEATWRFWDYGAPGLSVSAPEDFADVAELEVASTAQNGAALDAATTLRVRVFSNPGELAGNARVTVYPAGARQMIDQLSAADVQFVLPDGKYDVLVQAEQAEEWLKDVEVISTTVASQDVLFDFGTLEISVVQDGATPPVDIVIYPAGQRQTMADWRTENPTRVLLPAGVYDIEVALPDYTGSRAVSDVVVTAGSVTQQVIDLDAEP